MKAILVPAPGGPEALVFGEAPEPALRDGEVLVRVRATAVNRADLLQAAGKYPPPAGESDYIAFHVASLGETWDFGLAWAGSRNLDPGRRACDGRGLSLSGSRPGDVAPQFLPPTAYRAARLRLSLPRAFRRPSAAGS